MTIALICLKRFKVNEILNKDNDNVDYCDNIGV